MLGEPRLNARARSSRPRAEHRRRSGGESVQRSRRPAAQGPPRSGLPDPSQVAFSPDGRRGRVGASDEMQARSRMAQLLVQDVASGKLIKKLKSSGWPARIDFSSRRLSIHALRLGEGGRRKVSRTYCWDIESGTELGVDDGACSRGGTLWSGGSEGRRNSLTLQGQRSFAKPGRRRCRGVDWPRRTRRRRVASTGERPESANATRC